MKELSPLNAVSRFEKARAKRWPGLPTFATSVLYAIGAVIVVALSFQFFFRYQYLENNGVLWRVDRLTQQMCQVQVGSARCASESNNEAVAPKKVSTSTSTSTSLSTSVSLTVKPKRH
jgi:hypothetical protein